MPYVGFRKDEDGYNKLLCADSLSLLHIASTLETLGAVSIWVIVECILGPP